MRKKIAGFALSILVAASAAAHPHMSLVSRLEFDYDGDVCRGFWADWTFDPYFSASIIQEYDKDRSRRFDPTETKAVFGGAFSNLRKYGYFTYIRTGETRKNPESVEHFSAEIRGDRLAYRFYVRVGIKGEANVAIFDTTYFCAVEYPKDAPASVKQSKPGAAVPALKRAVDKEHPVFYDPSQSSTDNSRHTKWKPGLETAYPEEIRAKF